MVIQGKKLLCTLFTKSYSYTENYTITGKGFDFVFVWYWDTTTYGKLKQWRQPANETKIMCTKKKKYKTKSKPHKLLYLYRSKPNHPNFQLHNSKKMQIDWKGEKTVNSHWARFSALDVRQTFRSLFQSVVKLRFRSISSIYIWKKKLQKLKYLNLVFPTPPKKLSFAYGSVNNSYHYQKQNTSF